MPEGTEHRNLEGISNYSKFWQKDSKQDTNTDQDNRLTEYTSVVNGESLPSLGLVEIESPDRGSL